MTSAPIDMMAAWDNEELPASASACGDLYAASVVTHAPAYVRALRSIASATGPTLVHCSLVKDRTGVVVALALHAVGICCERIAADFGPSGEWQAEIDHLSRVTHLPADPAIMKSMLTSLASQHGDVLEPLRPHGLDDDLIDTSGRRMLGSGTD